uniref:Uncharacterized protein n=1 Tax=Setaria italica TaxID=4555 RepID=K3Y4J1_SETIT
MSMFILKLQKYITPEKLRGRSLDKSRDLPIASRLTDERIGGQH